MTAVTSPNTMQQTVFTIGHSNHHQDRFVELLKLHAITALCDVRSTPFSKRNPQFNREELKKVLPLQNIAYVYLGEELGARRNDSFCYEQGRVQFKLVARTESFQRGLRRVQEGMKNYRVALMCAEKEPLGCYRTILVTRHLVALGIEVQHIHADGRLESHAEAMSRLMQQFGISEEDMFRSHEELWAEAYERQEERMAMPGGRP